MIGFYEQQCGRFIVSWYNERVDEGTGMTVWILPDQNIVEYYQIFGWWDAMAIFPFEGGGVE